MIHLYNIMKILLKELGKYNYFDMENNIKWHYYEH